MKVAQKPIIYQLQKWYWCTQKIQNDFGTKFISSLFDIACNSKKEQYLLPTVLMRWYVFMAFFIKKKLDITVYA